MDRSEARSILARAMLAMTDPKKAKEELLKLTPEELDLELASAMKNYIALLSDIKAKKGGFVSNETPAAEPASKLLDYNKITLKDAIIDVLKNSKEPLNPSQISIRLSAAGREFDSNKPTHSVRMSLKRMLPSTPDLFHVGWAKWYLKSKCSKAKYEKYLEGSTTSGTGGKSKKEHAKRTAEGIARRRREGVAWGRKKTPPETIERAKEMLRAGTTLAEVCRTLKVSTPTLYENGIRALELKREGRRQREAELALGDQPEGDNVLPFSAKAANE
jgi:hypothetical protein